jgi:hypothetical protein
MRNRPAKPERGDLASPPPVGCVGVSGRLAALMAGQA